VRRDDHSETWFRTFCILITSRTLVSATDEVARWLWIYRKLQNINIRNNTRANSYLYTHTIRTHARTHARTHTHYTEQLTRRRRYYCTIHFGTTVCTDRNCNVTRIQHFHMTVGRKWLYNKAIRLSTSLKPIFHARLCWLMDFTEATDSEWQWHQLGHMQVCTSLKTDNHARTPPLSFYRPDALPVAQPTVSKHWR